ncbi:hypothetical protein LCGC14_1537890 [marine sediment metagenome]|uniref:Uncharacterized protein n=1 Tax=marine sediment metagenome TaxID=412755 RepID=A0A0F9L9W2_9ZZZZ
MSLMAEGTYSTNLTGAKVIILKGKEVMAVEFKIMHVANGDKWEPCPDPPTRSLWMSFTDAARPYTDKKLMALGFNGDFENPQFTETRPNLVCRHETYNGTVRDKWELADWDDGAGETIDTATALRMKADWDARHNKPAVPSGAPASPPSAPPAAGGIPF